MKKFKDKNKKRESEDEDNLMIISKLYRYKMLVIIYDLCEISPIPKEKANQELYLEYSFLNKEIK